EWVKGKPPPRPSGLQGRLPPCKAAAPPHPSQARGQLPWPGLFPYLQVYQCREVIAQDRLCQGPSQAPLLLLAIKSHLASGGRRATLRRTWAQPAEVGGFWLQPLFLLGVTSSQKQVKLAVQESHAFGDILMWDFMESHRNLPLKERCFLQWAHGHCQRAAFIFKGDDDVFVNPAALTRFLRRTPNASHFIHGHVHYHPAVKRIGRDAIPFLLFPLAHYPHFALEKGFLVPGAALPALYQASLWLPTFPLSGAYWGFLALAIQLPHRHSGDFRAWEKMNNHLTFYRESLLVHGISMERMEEVWQELRGSPLCPHPHQIRPFVWAHEPQANLPALCTPADVQPV
uniref:Hexosyltransferase n=1 Tax=Naja naja TaxID=35670 RepID=A0A8C6XUG3_NAJNA